MSHCIEVGAIHADLRTVAFSWKGLVQHFSLLSEAEGVGCIRQTADGVSQGFPHFLGEKSAVVSKQQLLNGFRVCEQTPKVEQTATSSETNVDAV